MRPDILLASRKTPVMIKATRWVDDSRTRNPFSSPFSSTGVASEFHISIPVQLYGLQSVKSVRVQSQKHA